MWLNVKMKQKKLNPVHPGEFLLEDFLVPLGISQSKLSRDIDVPVTRINTIIKGDRAVTPDTALRLGRYFGTGPEVWLNLQQKYDLQKAQDELLTQIQQRIQPINIDDYDLIEA